MHDSCGQLANQQRENARPRSILHRYCKRCRGFQCQPFSLHVRVRVRVPVVHTPSRTRSPLYQSTNPSFAGYYQLQPRRRNWKQLSDVKFQRKRVFMYLAIASCLRPIHDSAKYTSLEYMFLTKEPFSQASEAGKSKHLCYHAVGLLPQGNLGSIFICRSFHSSPALHFSGSS